ncbi:MAG TPA: TonB-dependent receptor [Candidatus Sulfotelmatobacter sp.]|nr:TonB-dependent receptor [Candidatus Sulfotelmatobacter sp.]
MLAQQNPTNQTSSLNPADTAGPAVYKKMSLEELMNQDVTSVAKQPEPYGQAPAAITVITGDEISRSGASSIPEALRLADNLEVAQKNSHDWGISARGFNTSLANKLLVLIDGRSVYTPLYSGVFWDVQDYLLEDIDRIEVISGPGGTLWGANAVNGVINITTKSAKDTQGFYSEAGGGSWLQDFAGIRYGGVLTSNVYYRVYGKYFDRGDEFLANGTNASDSWRMGQGGFRIDSEAVPQNTFTLQGDFYLGDENLETGGDARTGGGNILSRWVHTFSDDSDMQLQLYYDQTHLREDAPALQIGALLLAPPGIFTDALDTYDVDFQDRFSLGERNHVVWGLGYRFTQEVEDNAPSLAFFPAVENQNLFSGFAQDELRLWKDVFFTLGSKVEHNDYTGFEYEPSGRLQWNATTNQMFWGAVSRAVRTPSRIDHDLSEGEPPYFVLLRGGNGFESEKLIAYELGYRARLGSKVATSISAYYNQYDDVRSTSFTPATILPLFFQNNLEGDTYGVELSADYQVLDWWRLHGGYDFLSEHLRIKPGQTDVNNALNETADPEHQFSIRSSMDLPHQVQLDTDLRWVDTLHNNNGATPGTVPSYFELDVRLAWRVSKNVELSIVGQNLLHDHHPEYGFPSPTREEIGRNVYGKVSWQF